MKPHKIRYCAACDKTERGGSHDLWLLLHDALTAAEIECDASLSPSAPAAAELCRKALDALGEAS